MNSWSSAKATMPSYAASVSRLDSPRKDAFRYTFSLPVSSGWNPAPSSSKAASRPRCRTIPEVGRRIPATILSRVVLPEPLCPIRPSELPSGTWTDTSRRAQKSSARNREWRTLALREVGRSRYSRNFLDRKSTRLNSSHITISYAVFCLKKKKKKKNNKKKKKKKKKKKQRK